MPYAVKVNTLQWSQPDPEIPGEWIDGPQIVVTKNSVSKAVAPQDAADKTQVWLSDGSSIRVNQDLDAIETFLNS